MQLKRITVTRKQTGIGLIEALVALIVLGIGIMGMAGMQTRLIAESRTAIHRANAISLIDDLTNRMLLNRDAALANDYKLAWGEAKNKQDCVNNPCTGTQLALSDLNIWQTSITTTLPNGNATVFQSPTDPRQIGIAIAWASNEGKAADADTATYTQPFNITSTTHGVTCPNNSICHLVYVQP